MCVDGECVDGECVDGECVVGEGGQPWDLMI